MRSVRVQRRVTETRSRSKQTEYGECPQSPQPAPPGPGLLHEYMGHDVSNMRGFDSYRLLTLFLAALMTRISSAMIQGAHASAGAATLARTVPFWVRLRSLREPTAGPCRGCLLPSATNTAPSRHHLQGCPNATILALATSNPRAVWVVLTSTDARGPR